MTQARISELLKQGIAAAQAGEVAKAQKILTQVTTLDDRNEQAWLWLSSLADDAWDRYFCLQKVREINPQNVHARAGLEFLEQQSVRAASAHSVPDSEPDARLPAEGGQTGSRSSRKDRKKRLWLSAALSLLLLMFVGVVALFVRYVSRPAPLPDLLPIPVNVSYPPHYLFSIYGTTKPVGVALSPEGERIYVAESGGERMVRIFDRAGQAIGAFAPPRTDSGERTPVYLSTDSAGRVFVTDRLQHAVLVYDQDGSYLDTILAPDLTLSEYVGKHVSGLGSDIGFAYNRFEADVYYGPPGDLAQTLPAPGPTAWSPLGLRIDRADQVLVTDILGSRHAVREISAAAIRSPSWADFDPPQHLFGETGGGNGQLFFPNTAVSDSQGRIYVTDGNNGRIVVWSRDGRFVLNFGQGTGEGALDLPRGAAIDARDRLYIVDAVGQKVLVYDVSGAVPAYLFSFGKAGLSDGQFNYPNDIALDASGRLYIADRENDRIQVWSY